MKRIVLYISITLAVLGIFILLGWQSISTTLGWYALLFNVDNSALTVSPTNLILPAPEPTGTELATFDQASFPVLQNSTPELRNGSSSLVVTLNERNASYYIATMTPFANRFAANPGLSQEFKDIICSDTHWSLRGNPCETNQAFLSTMLSINPDDVSVFSSRETKIIHSSFTALKNLYIAADTTDMYTLNSDEFTGYLTYSPTVSLAFIFDTTGNQYELSFLSMTKEEVLDVLSGITRTTPQ